MKGNGRSQVVGPLVVVSVIAVACSSGLPSETDSEGAAGSLLLDGSSGNAGTGGSAGSLPDASTGGSAGKAGSAGEDGGSGQSGTGGVDASAGTAGAAGIDASAGTAGEAGIDAGAGQDADGSDAVSEDGAVCTVGQKQCNGQVPQTCDANGQWESGAPCSGVTPICSAGACVCPGTGGPSMVAMPQGYCIDSTEVTYAQYHDWQSTAPATGLMPSYCTSWKSSYNAGSGSGSHHPVGDVDWCDAYAYCQGVGKRLCGKIGGGSNLFADLADAGLSQWFNACSSGGTYAYPYGNTYEPQTCNGADHSAAVSTVGSLAGCDSSVLGYTGVYDLSGNVFEWEDSCTGATGMSDGCRIRGGSFVNAGGTYLTCALDVGGANRYGTSYNIGFRCCAP